MKDRNRCQKKIQMYNKTIYIYICIYIYTYVYAQTMSINTKQCHY